MQKPAEPPSDGTESAEEKVDMLRRHRNKKVLEDEALVLQYLWDLKGLHKDQ